jgi:prephenate dehydratase
MMSNTKNNIIAFQGELGANGDLACRAVRSDMKTLPCHTFEDTFAAVNEGKAKYLLIPIDNTVAGRVADIHHLLPRSGLHIIGEHFQRVEHHLLVVKGTQLEELTHVHSHVHALNQCKIAIKDYGLEPMVHVDTAAAAREISERGERAHAAIASELAGKIYGLDSLRGNIEDADHNTTRFLLMAQEPIQVLVDDNDLITSFVFRVRNVSAALYKALGGFATNGVNMLKLESYLVGGGFVAAQFYAEVEGHPENPGVRMAMEELAFFTHEVRTLGVYPRNSARDIINKNSIG